MEGIDNKYIICPKCGCKLVDININNEKSYKLCPESTCRTMINGETISEMELDIYSRLQQRVGFNKEHTSSGIKAYMLLKEDLSGPLLVKNARNSLSRTKTAFCIVKANSIDDAIKQFKERFELIKITKDTVVEISILENESWI